MKTVNFLDTLPLKERRRILRWWHISIGLCCLMIAIIAIVQMRQFFLYRIAHTRYLALQKNENEYNQARAKLTELQTVEKGLQERLSAGSKYKTGAQKIERQLKILQAIGQDVALQSFERSLASAQLLFVASSIDKISAAVQTLNKDAAFGFLSIVSMRPKDKTYLFTVRESY